MGRQIGREEEFLWFSWGLACRPRHSHHQSRQHVGHLDLFPQMRLIPTQKISMEPVSDKLSRAAGVMRGAMTRERAVISL